MLAPKRTPLPPIFNVDMAKLEFWKSKARFDYSTSEKRPSNYRRAHFTNASGHEGVEYHKGNEV
jgi:hypothetical protein